ncbi:flagellar protein [Anaerosinus massiliensis]|uniref:flagellar protein n=1 Tax=Massilibacillus massiliensis TaxID=1806837 RepID=UPI000DA62890|nr:flagellar protein [Massilibacillus massiliensis]
MEIGSCPECGKVFIKDSGRICPECMKKEEEYERLIAEYVRTHRRCTVEEIHEVTGIKIAVIYRMIENGRIQECGNIYYPCEQCKKIINKGRLCKTCMKSFLDQVKELKCKNGNQAVRMYSKIDEIE